MSINKIHKNTTNWLLALFAIQLISLVLAFYAQTQESWHGIPQVTVAGFAVCLSFILSSIALLYIVPRLGLVSSIAYGALVVYSAISVLFTGKIYLLWCIATAVPALALIALAVYAWLQLNKARKTS
ncbi:hypothetical protein KJY77_06070 [Canibacter sp. lx-72]|uniref:hypothetical protein n=1 Tax=Canibacter zhuwentaonis TaxID=2837491 RepID=UPI001BDC2632|nr:hypothetical protein [Canibacter zhuwentaonis]MBT1018694.1 hypothetical protein [Canibacter zhuwentaonis]MBT1035885.1 hypothetical protein [Canibacter zhuwentaonis]